MATAQVGNVRGAVLAVSLKLNSQSSGLIGFETEGAASIFKIAGGTLLNVSTGTLSGTTGADGALNVSVTDSGVLYFENRTGVARTVVWKIISRDL